MFLKWNATENKDDDERQKIISSETKCSEFS